MTVDTEYKSGKSERDENFPVASLFVAPRFRAPDLGVLSLRPRRR